MNLNIGKKLFRKCNQKNFHPQYVVEVGVYLPETSNIIDYIRQNTRATLVEPDLKTVEKIKTFFRDMPHLTIHPLAVFDYNGSLTLIQRNASTFAQNLSASPALVNDKYIIQDTDKFEVPCVTFDTIDDGSINLLSVDIEGGEWYVIKHLKSRPQVISLETHGKIYINPFITEIKDWMKKENYVIWYKDKSDTVFVQKDSFQISFQEKFNLQWMNFRLNFRRIRKKIGL
jgi:FkbM family methyltransferase